MNRFIKFDFYYQNWAIYIFTFIAFLSLSFPAKLMSVKAFFLVLLLPFIVLKIKHNRMSILSKAHWSTLLITTLYSIIPFIIGYLNDFNPIYQVKVFFLWPLLFMLIFSCLTKKNLIDIFDALVIIAFVNVVVLTLLLIFGKNDLLWRAVFGATH